MCNNNNNWGKVLPSRRTISSDESWTFCFTTRKNFFTTFFYYFDWTWRYWERLQIAWIWKKSPVNDKEIFNSLETSGKNHCHESIFNMTWPDRTRRTMKFSDVYISDSIIENNIKFDKILILDFKLFNQNLGSISFKSWKLHVFWSSFIFCPFSAIFLHKFQLNGKFHFRWFHQKYRVNHILILNCIFLGIKIHF